MAQTQKLSGTTMVVDMGEDLIRRAKTAIDRNREYNRVYNELAALSDRELNDINVGRGDIARIATEAAKAIR